MATPGQDPKVVPNTTMPPPLRQSSRLHRTVARTMSTITTLIGIFCTILVVVDVLSNNWLLNNFTGDAKHFFTPLLTTYSITDLENEYYFPTKDSPSHLSKIGRFMVETIINQIHDKDDTFYYLTMGSHMIQNPENDICGELKHRYPIDALPLSRIRLGYTLDQITFVRGNTLSHLFSDTATKPQAQIGDNSSKLVSMGYIPSRVGLDMRLTTTLVVPQVGQEIVANVTMYRFFSKAFCSGCNPGTELGMDTCLITYIYDPIRKEIDIRSSKANYGQYHVLGMIFNRRVGSMISLIIRAVCLFVAINAFAASQKTVQWTDPLALKSWFKKIKNVVAPPQYRHVSYAFHFLYFCFNSDLFVFLYSVSVAIDEDVSMVYARVVGRWTKPADFNPWTELRMRALSFRWLWFNLALLKIMKWLCHFISTARYNGANFVMGWLNFSTVTWVYLTVFALLERHDYIEYGNSIRNDLTSEVQDLDSIYVEFGDSWYIRGLTSLVFLMIANLLMVLLVDHAVNRRWWRLMAKNSLGRQHMYNSTSILTDMNLVIEDGSMNSVVTIKARTTCTYLWFFTSHLTCFGLPEDPQYLRQMVSAKAGKSRISVNSSNQKQNSSHGCDGSSSSPTKRNITGSQAHAPESSHQSEPVDSTTDTLIMAQDKEGNIGVFDSDKKQLQALGVEVKILRDAVFYIG